MTSNRSNPRRISRREFLKLAAAGAAGLLVGCCPAPQASGTLALANGTLIDGTGADPVPDGVVVVQDGRITAVGPRDRVDTPTEARVVDVDGATILPGFINAHVHAAYDEDTLEAWAKGGVTTVRDLGAFGPYSAELFDFRDEVNEKLHCARLVAVGSFINVAGGYPIVYWDGNAVTIESPEDARQKVHQLIDDGADVIKTAIESGVTFGQSGWPLLSPEEAAAIVEAAHERDTPVSVHVTVSRDLERALDAGMDEIAHMVTDWVPDELIARMADSDTYWVPTLELWQGVSRNYSVNYGAMTINNLGRFVEAGGRVALGTDYAGAPNIEFDLGMPIHEIGWMQEAGMAPMDIIVAATKYAAHVCNLGQEIGTLEPGKAADILVVDGNPLEDIHALAETKMVFREGISV
jgi:imidazolonepropionase-like amidohydrolase